MHACESTCTHGAMHTKVRARVQKKIKVVYDDAGTHTYLCLPFSVDVHVRLHALVCVHPRPHLYVFVLRRVIHNSHSCKCHGGCHHRCFVHKRHRSSWSTILHCCLYATVPCCRAVPSCCAVLCRAVPCRAMPCHAVPCHADIARWGGVCICKHSRAWVRKCGCVYSCMHMCTRSFVRTQD